MAKRRDGGHWRHGNRQRCGSGSAGRQLFLPTGKFQIVAGHAGANQRSQFPYLADSSTSVFYIDIHMTQRMPPLASK